MAADKFDADSMASNLIYWCYGYFFTWQLELLTKSKISRNLICLYINMLIYILSWLQVN